MKKITFFGGDNKKHNQEALTLLKTLPLDIDHAGDYPFMKEQFNMPFIHTSDGFRYEGLEDIKFFVKIQKKETLPKKSAFRK